MFSLISAASLLGLIPAALSANRTFDLTIENKVIAPDGFERSAIVVNGGFPGPFITGEINDTFHLVTHNALEDPTMRRSFTIHWHGLFQSRTSYADGPAFVNQCPIGPNQTFNYDFSVPGQSGNYWYHSHYTTQYCDGLRGALALYDPNDPLADLYDVDDETTVITLADWYHTVAPVAQDNYYHTGVAPVPDSTLINGVGRYAGGPEVPFAVVNVIQGKRYRFRIFQISCRPFNTFSVDNHNLTFIEADGIEHDPTPFHSVDIFAAQRISVILEANQTVDNYWIRAPPTGGAIVAPELALAILRYEGAPEQEPPMSNATAGTKLDDRDMHPIPQVGPGDLGSAPPDVHIDLNISQPNPPFFDINNISFVTPTVPVLLQILSGAKKPQDVLPSDQIFFIPRNKIIEVTIPGPGPHPFHLHGHTFDVTQPTNVNTTNFVNPLRRDTYPVNGGNTTLRFMSNNPGAWIFHCHIDWHLEVGLSIVFAEAPEDNVSGNATQITPQDWEDLCPDYDALDPHVQ